MPSPVLTGLDVLRLSDFEILKDKKVGIVCNPASVDSHLNHIIDLVSEAENCKLVKLFAPEHGVRGALQDMQKVNDSVDERTLVPIVSLYGESSMSLIPKKDMLEDIDIVLFDLQDVGSRYYTYAQTLAFIMQTAYETKTHVIVIDRPNPINGIDMEGANLMEDCRSFCGLYPVPNRHGLTMGELARVVKNGFFGNDYKIRPIDCNLTIIPMDGWKREMYFEDTGLPWVLPSPNMPSIEAAVTYPGTCLFEATNISEGRGTTKPFEFLGAPYIDGHDWAEETLKCEIPLEGAILRPTYFVPKFSKWADKQCGGVQMHVTDRKKYKPFVWSLAMIAAAAKLYPETFAWRTGAYEFIDNKPAIDLLYGNNKFRKIAETKRSISALSDDMKSCVNFFEEIKSEYLMY